jgi:hypothetical protein
MPINELSNVIARNYLITCEISFGLGMNLAGSLCTLLC